MSARNRTKAEALASIVRGPAFVRLVRGTTYHIGVMAFGSYDDGVWLTL